MGRFVIVAYRPYPGEEERPLELTKSTCRSFGATDGTIFEVFEWKSAEAIAAAHQNPVWQAMCGRYSEVCECVSLENLNES